MWARALVVACAWRPRRMTNIVAPIANHAARAMTTKAATIRPVRLLGGTGVSVRVADGARQRLAAWRHEAISVSANRLDGRPVLAELLADLGDMHVHGSRLAP